MPILPSGKKRIMEAQSSLGLGNEWGTPVRVGGCGWVGGGWVVVVGGGGE